MKLENLKRSAELNDSEEISVYLAFCFIDSIFKDVRTESGMKIEDCPVGNERQLPAVISRFCRVLKNIYINNSEKMQQFRSSLEKQLADVDRMRADLDDAAEIADKLEQSKNEIDDLRAELERMHLKKAEYDRNQEECCRLRREKEELDSFDAQSVREETERLRTECSALKTEIDGLNDSKNKSEAQVEELKKCRDSINNKISQLNSEKDRLVTETKELEGQITDQEKIKNDIISETEKKIAEKVRISDENDRLNNELSVIRDETAALELNKEMLNKELESIKNEKDRLTSEESVMKGNISEITCIVAALQLSISGSETEFSKKREKAAELREREKILTAENQSLSAEVDDLFRKNEEISGKIAQLKEELIPNQKLLLDTSAEKHNALLAELNEKQTHTAHLDAEIKKLESDNQRMDETLDSQENIKRSLTEALAISNEKIRRLDEQLNDLRGKNDRERQEKMKKQLQAEIEEHEKARKDCIRLQSEIERVAVELQKAQDERKKREEARNNLDASKAQVEALISRLESTLPEDHRAKLDMNRQRLEMMRTISDSLERSAEKMAKFLNLHFADGEFAAASNLNKTITALCGRTVELQDSLAECARLCSAKINLEVH